MINEKKRSRSKRPFIQKEKRAKRKRDWGGGAAVVGSCSNESEAADSSIQLEAIARGKMIFENYYRLQQICDSDTDLDQLCESMCRPLPIAFRMCGAASRKDETDAVIQPVLSLLQEFPPRRVAGVLVQAPTYFPWCRAWQLGCDDRVLRAELRAGDPNSDLSRLARWLNAANTAGVASRQEVRHLQTSLFSHPCSHPCARGMSCANSTARGRPHLARIPLS
jgi:hypothetical protein